MSDCCSGLRMQQKAYEESRAVSETVGNSEGEHAWENTPRTSKEIAQIANTCYEGKDGQWLQVSKT